MLAQLEAPFLPATETFVNRGATGNGIKWPTTTGKYWSFYMAEGTFGENVDPATYWGYNVKSTGGRINTSTPAVWLGFEADYVTSEPAGVHTHEMNLDYISASGTTKRFMAWRAFCDDSASSTYKNRSEWSFVADGPAVSGSRGQSTITRFSLNRGNPVKGKRGFATQAVQRNYYRSVVPKVSARANTRKRLKSVLTSWNQHRVSLC